MGLDICVRRLVNKPKNEESKHNYFRLIDDEGNYDNQGFPEWTKKFEHNKLERWYDWDAFKKKTGINMEEMVMDGVSYGPHESYMTVHHKNDVLPEYKEDYPGGYDAYREAVNKVKLRINFKDVPTKRAKVKVIYWEEVGYQRKGLNSNFYQDYRDEKIGYFVWTKAELERYKDEYCDEPYEYEYPNGEKSGNMVYPKLQFQRNIIDNFEEGKDCVIFDW